MRVKYVRNTENLNENGRSNDTIAEIGKIYRVSAFNKADDSVLVNVGNDIDIFLWKGEYEIIEEEGETYERIES
jgi:hypothetical protein